MRENNRLFSRRDIAKIIVPLIFQNLFAITIGMADSIMVASYSGDAFAGVSLVNSLDVLLITLFSSIAVGGSVVLAQAMGQNDRKLSCDSAKQLLYITTAIATAISTIVLILRTPLLNLLFGEVDHGVMVNALSYFSIVAVSFPFLAVDSSVAAILRAQGDSMTSLKVSIFMNLLNIGGNAFFIFGLDMGSAGAALATLVSRIVGATIMTFIVRRPKRFIFIDKILSYRPNKAIIKSILKIGIPNGIENSLFQLGRLMTSSLVSSLGTVAINANSAALSLANIQYNVGGAVQNTMIAVVGRCVGANERKQAKHYTFRLLGIGYIAIFAVVGLTCLLSTPLLGMYSLTEDGFITAKQLLFYHGVASVIMWATAFCLPSAFRAAGDIKFTMVISIVSMWIFRVALAYFLAKDRVSVFGLFGFEGLGMGVMGVWIAMTADWVVRALIFTCELLSERWLNHNLLISQKANKKSSQ